MSFFRKQIGKRKVRQLEYRKDVGGLIKLLDYGDRDVVHNARDALIGIGHTAVDALIAALNDTDNNRREKIAGILAGIEDDRATESLALWFDEQPGINEYNHVSWGVGRTAVFLGKRRDPRAVPVLVAMLSDNLYCAEAAPLLGQIGDTRCVQPLINLLSKLFQTYLKQDAKKNASSEQLKNFSGDSHSFISETLSIERSDDIIDDLHKKILTVTEALEQIGTQEAMEGIVNAKL